MRGAPRRAISTPGTGRARARRGPGGLLVSLAIHTIAIVLIVRVVVMPPDFRPRAGREAEPLPVDRIGFLALPRGERPQRATPRSGGDNRPVRAAPAAPPPVAAPAVVPVEIPAPPRPVAPVSEPAGAGPVVGAGGATVGVRPLFTDPRIWAPRAPLVVAPTSPKQRIDSAIAARVRALEDSLAALPRERAPGDWTFEHRGKKYGIDQRYIHLGDFSLPTAVLALLPMNQQANPLALERSRRLQMMRGEIQEQAARVGRDEDFRAAVKALRERKEKEREESKKKAVAEPPPKPAPDAR